jgi:lysozyme
MRLYVVLSVVAAAAYLAWRNTSAMDTLDMAAADDTGEPEQLPTTLETIAVTFTPSTYDSGAVSDAQAQRNVRAFLDMISYSEGTNGPDGYSAMFGYPRPDRIATNLADHPRRYFTFTNKAGQTLQTSAAGRYQFLARTWDELASSLQLPDFGPDSQDRACIELIRQRGALNDVRAGRVTQAIEKCAKTWASLPGAGYAQPERKLSTLVAQYSGAGGSIEAA